MPPTIPDIADADRIALTRRPEGRPVMYQSWQRLLFLHWEVPADSLRRLLPDGVELDLFEGRAFVGLVPFTMRGVRPRGLPAVRGLSHFHETNVRTYVHHRGGRPGVWFFSLDAANAVSAALGASLVRPAVLLRQNEPEIRGIDERPPALLRLGPALPQPEAGDNPDRG